MVELCDNDNSNDKLSDENLLNLCRLCLQNDDFIVNIFHRLDPNPNKKPLPERIYDLYQIKVKQSDGLPTNICHRCLYFTEAFSEYRENVRKCESRLQKYIAKIGIMGSSVKPQNLLDAYSINNAIKTETIDDNAFGGNGSTAGAGSIEDYNSVLPDEDGVITVVVDPYQDYESSNEDFSLDSDDEYAIHQHKISQQAPSPLSQRKSPTIVAATITSPIIATTTVTTTSPAVTAATSKTDIYHKNIDDNGEKDDNGDSLTLRNVFLCQYCDMAFISQIECAEHESRHDAANPHSCNYCPFRCSSRHAVITHIKGLHDGERPYVCVQCDKTFGRRSDLKKHTTVHTGVRPFGCTVCGKSFSRNTNLTKHLRIHTSLRPYVCQKCPRSFTTSEDLNRHEKIHNNQKVYKCSQCALTFTRKDKLMSHELSHTKKLSNKSGGNNKSSNSGKQPEMQKLNQQQQQQMQHIQQQMLQIHQQIQQQYQQQQHQQTTQQQQQQQLSQSENIVAPLSLFTNINQPENNSQSNQPDPIFKKPLSSAKSSLAKIAKEKSQQQKKKSAKSTGDGKTPVEPKPKREIRRNFICPVCSKPFLRRRELQRHSFIHTGIKPFPCQYCPKRFSRKDKATHHEKSHFEDKFPCSFCQMIFSNQPALDTHLKVHELDRAISTAAAMTEPPPQMLQPPPLPSLHLQQSIHPGSSSQMLAPGIQQPPFGGQSSMGYPSTQQQQQHQQQFFPQQQYHQQQQQHQQMMKMKYQQQLHQQPMMQGQLPMFRDQQEFYQYNNYQLPQLNFYSEIQPENSEN